MEDCFVAAQAGQIQLGSDAVDVLLRGVDALERLAIPADSTAETIRWRRIRLEQLLAQLSAVRLGQPLPSLACPRPKCCDPPSKINRGGTPPFRTACRNKEKTNTRRIDATLDEFVLEAKEHLAAMVNDLLELEKSKDRADARCIDRLFRAVHSVKGGAGFFGCRVIESLAHAMEEVLEELRQHAKT